MTGEYLIVTPHDGSGECGVEASCHVAVQGCVFYDVFAIRGRCWLPADTQVEQCHRRSGAVNEAELRSCELGLDRVEFGPPILFKSRGSGDKSRLAGAGGKIEDVSKD